MSIQDKSIANSYYFWLFRFFPRFLARQRFRIKHSKERNKHKALVWIQVGKIFIFFIFYGLFTSLFIRIWVFSFKEMIIFLLILIYKWLKIHFMSKGSIHLVFLVVIFLYRFLNSILCEPGLFFGYYCHLNNNHFLFFLLLRRRQFNNFRVLILKYYCLLCHSRSLNVYF